MNISLEELELEGLVKKEALKLSDDLEKAYGDEDSTGYLDILNTLDEVHPDATNEEKLKYLKYIRSMSGLNTGNQKTKETIKKDKMKLKNKKRMKKKSKRKNRKK